LLEMEYKTLKEAFLASPGPQEKRDYAVLFAKAFCMGVADLIPGVSGGTIAFITGIYEGLLDAVGSVNKKSIGAVLKGDIKTALSIVHIRFLIPLVLGMLSAIFMLARLMHYLITDHPIPTWAMFFGLIAASIIVIFKQLEDPKKWDNILSLLVGGVFAWVMVSLIPVDTPTDSWFIYLCGVIGISAMILPGLSGSFLLLILGKYEFITGAVKSPFVDGNFTILLTFVAGSLTGVAGFSRVLNWFLKHYHGQTMAFLTGILIGSMKKVWPWKEVLETKVIRGKTRILREANILPESFDNTVLLAIALCIVGFFLVIWMESRVNKKAIV
jgi:putative membrane protein